MNTLPIVLQGRQYDTENRTDANKSKQKPKSCRKKVEVEKERKAGEMFGYARVSTKEQNLDRQIIALKSFGVPESNMFVEKQSGKDFNRPVYQSLIENHMRPGDVLVVMSIDRLGRNYTEIGEQWDHITNDLNLDIVVMDFEALDTRKRENTLTGKFISELILKLMAYVAANEREIIHDRQMQGIAAAKLRGVKFGRPKMQKPSDYERCKEAYLAGQMSCRVAGKICGVDHTTFLKWLKKGDS